MVNGVILLVDAAEGPLPQTKFVLRKSLELGYRPIVLLNKVDRSDARPDDVLNEVFDLFVSLHATDEQLDFPVLYAVGLKGIATKDLQNTIERLEEHKTGGTVTASGTTQGLYDLFELIVEHVPAPEVGSGHTPKMLVSNVDWNDYVGRIAIGRLDGAKCTTQTDLVLVSPDGKQKSKGRVSKLFTFHGLQRTPIESIEPGDIIALAGFEEVEIGDTLTGLADPTPLEKVNIDQPTLAMFFRVNTSPFAGKEGDYVTSNQLKDRLFREIRTNVSIRVETTDNPDIFRVSGRGELQLAILIETMRREGYEFSVSRPEVLTKEENGQTLEPYEEVVVDVHMDYSSKVIDQIQKRRGVMLSMDQEGENHRLTFKVPSRGLIGYRGEMLTDTRGTGVMHQQFDSYGPYAGEISGRSRGALIALEAGDVTSYALEGLQDRGLFLVEPGVPVYTGQVVGIHNRADDLIVNVVKKKNLTNHRASQTADAVKLSKAATYSLEQSIEFIDRDELLEVTPQSLRIRKSALDHNERKRLEKKKEGALV
jgi:GTP-binding protein